VPGLAGVTIAIRTVLGFSGRELGAVNIADAPYRQGWPAFALYRPHPSRSQLAQWLDDAHALTRALFGVLDAARLQVPLLPIVNPPRWELGHVAWFHEFWTQRRGNAEAASMLAGADRLYDSARVAHDSRWSLDLPDMAGTWGYLERVLARTHALLERDEMSDELAYFIQLSILHHDMHNEAFCYMWQTLGHPAPLPTAQSSPAGDACGGDVSIPAGRLQLGAPPASGFVFDNEKWVHEVAVPAFAMARCAVSNREFLAFVENGGYARREFWSEAGWHMREMIALGAPRYWKKDSSRWQARRFDHLVPLPLEEPVMHVSWHEAQAYCRWAKRRLPTEMEWERAAATMPDSPAKCRYSWGDSCESANGELARLGARVAAPASVDAFPAGASAWGLRQMLGNVWEWTESRFVPYPGFSPDPYKEYSEPWFAEDHRVLRGGSFATPLRLIRNSWRNFYKPERADVFCGFRTCAL
jgi:iron(II)-dependent oxidoreductase